MEAVRASVCSKTEMPRRRKNVDEEETTDYGAPDGPAITEAKGS